MRQHVEELLRQLRSADPSAYRDIYQAWWARHSAAFIRQTIHGSGADALGCMDDLMLELEGFHGFAGKVKSWRDAHAKRARSDGPTAPGDPEVTGRLRKNSFGDPLTTRGNVEIVLTRDPDVANRYRLNRLDERVYLGDRPVEDTDITSLALWMERVYGFAPDPRSVGDVVQVVAHRSAWHPVLSYLSGLTWDGTHRAESMLSRGFGVADSPLTRALSLRFLVGAVRRVTHPGCQLDTMLVLQGKQGAGKSQGVKALCGRDWFRDSDFDVQSKDAFAAIQGAWIYEIGELEKWNRREQSVIKAFLSSQKDSYRPPYGKHLKDVDRQTVFVGTTNADTFLEDVTGSRRFQPVTVTSVDIAWIREHRDQLWAEAVWHEERDEPHWLTDEEAGWLEEASEEYRTTSPLEAEVLRAATRESKHGISPVTIAEVVQSMDGKLTDVPRLRHDVAKTLKAHGWGHQRVRGEDGTRFRAWTPPGWKDAR